MKAHTKSATHLRLVPPEPALFVAVPVDPPKRSWSLRGWLQGLFRRDAFIKNYERAYLEGQE